VALAEKYLGTWYENRQRNAEAVPHFRRALELDTRCASLRADNRQALLDVAIDQSNVATVLRSQGDTAAAIVLMEQSVATRRLLAETDPTDVLAASRLGVALERLGYVYWIARRLQDALATDEEAVRVLARSVDGRRDVVIIAELAAANTDLGAVYEALGRPVAACAAYRRAEQQYREIERSDDVQRLIQARRGLSGTTCH
jgi:tetratricopeptide (TPR) repeat protein